MSHLVCEFCTKKFSTVYNLNNHKKTAIYCIKARGENVTKQYTCEFCEEHFTQKSTLTKHIEICNGVKTYVAFETQVISLKEKLKNKSQKNADLTKKLKLAEASILQLTQKLQEKEGIIEKIRNEEIIAKDKKISDLEKTIEFGKGVLVGYEKVKPPNVTNNTVVNQKLANLKVDNIRPLTIGTIIEDIPKYTFDMYMGAETGIVQFMKHLTQLEMEDGSIERNYACTDKSRSTFHRLMESKEWKHDGGSKFINDVFDNLADKAIEHWDTLISLSKNPDILEQHYYAGKMVEMTSFQSSFTSKGKHREEYFNKVKSKMKDVSSV